MHHDEEVHRGEGVLHRGRMRVLWDEGQPWGEKEQVGMMHHQREGMGENSVKVGFKCGYGLISCIELLHRGQKVELAKNGRGRISYGTSLVKNKCSVTQHRSTQLCSCIESRHRPTVEWLHHWEHCVGAHCIATQACFTSTTLGWGHVKQLYTVVYTTLLRKKNVDNPLEKAQKSF